MSDQGSMFDATSFLSEAIEGANSTEIFRLPVGFETQGTVSDVSVNGGYSDKMNDGAGGHWASLKIKWEITDEEALSIVKRDKCIVKQDLFLDLDAEGKISISDGANVLLGRLRAALNQNDPSTAWAPTYMIGQSARLVIGDEMDSRDENKPADKQRFYNTVTAVAAL